MQKQKTVVRLICALAISMPLLGMREPGGSTPADVNGDQRVDVRDLQAIIARSLQPSNTGNAKDARSAGHSSVLDFQRALREVQLGKNERQLPLSAPSGPETCVFGYQTGRIADLVDCEVQASPRAAFPPVLSEPGEHAERCVVPTTAERYLFFLTPNAPSHIA